MSVILGIDASTKFIGYAAYDTETGVLLGSGEQAIKSADALARIREAVCRFEEIVEFWRQHPRLDCIAIEQPFAGPSGKTSMQLGALFGALIVAAQAWPVMSVTPAEAKLAATGRGNADKKMVMQMVAAQFGLDVKVGEHQADAVAVALAAAGKLKVEALR